MAGERLHFGCSERPIEQVEILLVVGALPTRSHETVAALHYIPAREAEAVRDGWVDGWMDRGRKGWRDGESDREREEAPERERGRQTDAQTESKSTIIPESDGSGTLLVGRSDLQHGRILQDWGACVAKRTVEPNPPVFS